MENVECGVPGCAGHVRTRFAEVDRFVDGEGHVHPIFETEQDYYDLDSTLFEANVRDVYTEAQAVLLKKHQDYGPKNISDSPGGPLNGLRVRMHDKLARINNLVDSGAEPQNESLKDSFLDLMNYAAIGQLVIDGNWPES